MYLFFVFITQFINHNKFHFALELEIIQELEYAKNFILNYVRRSIVDIQSNFPVNTYDDQQNRANVAR